MARALNLENLEPFARAHMGHVDRCHRIIGEHGHKSVRRRPRQIAARHQSGQRAFQPAQINHFFRTFHIAA